MLSLERTISGSIYYPPRKKWIRSAALGLVGLLIILVVSAIFLCHSKREKGTVMKILTHDNNALISRPKEDKNLVWEEHLRTIDRPKYVVVPNLKRPDHLHLFSKTMQDVLKLKEQNITFRAIVFGWKRRASLKRLVDSLLAAHYHGFTIHLDFHLDGGAHEKVISYVEEVQWPFGRMRVNQHSERTIMEGWKPVSDKEYAFFFEDDIEVSPWYFEYSLIALKKYLYPKGGRAPSTPWNARFAGISLNTPRYNEIRMPPVDWVPQEEIGESETQFLFQLPCSWGALFIPWIWRDFLKYYLWRRENTPEELHMSIPDSATMHWRASWKKYLIEFMYMRGLYMLYPSLPRQLSFSTHHREPGEHTDAKPQEHLVDDLGTLFLDYFTVPLVTENDLDHYYRLIAEMKPLRELPVVSFHHERVKDIHSLTQIGTFTVKLMTGAGWDHSRYMKNPGCILDSVTFPVFNNSRGRGEEKFLLFEPQASLAMQLNGLRNAIAYSKILDRTLIVPPFVASSNVSNTVSIDRIINLKVRNDTFVKMISLEDFAQSHHGWIERITQFTPWLHRRKTLFSQMRDNLLHSFSLYPAQEAVIYIFPNNQSEIVDSLAECHDQVLAFRHLFGSFTNFTTSEDHEAFTSWSRDNMQFTEPILKVMDQVSQQIPKPFACAVWSRGDIPSDCGRDVLRIKEPTQEQKLIAFRSCQPSFDRTMQYAVEDAIKLNITLKAVYAMAEQPIPEIIEPQKQAGDVVQVLSKTVIMQHVTAMKGLDDLPPDVQSELGDIIEMRLCENAAFFLGNIYSSLSNRTLTKRGNNRPSNLLGLSL